MAIIYTGLAMSLRSLAIILPIHLHVYIYSHSSPRVQPYPYTAGRWRMRPYSRIALSVNGYVSLTGFASLHLFRRVNISKMYFSHWKPPGVSERMWSVNLDE